VAFLNPVNIMAKQTAQPGIGVVPFYQSDWSISNHRAFGGMGIVQSGGKDKWVVSNYTFKGDAQGSVCNDCGFVGTTGSKGAVAAGANSSFSIANVGAARKLYLRVKITNGATATENVAFEFHWNSLVQDDAGVTITNTCNIEFIEQPLIVNANANVWYEYCIHCAMPALSSSGTVAGGLFNTGPNAIDDWRVDVIGGDANDFRTNARKSCYMV